MEDIIIKVLRAKQGFVSGQEISRTIGVSRTAIWKHIKELRNKGYEIESRSKMGYRLIKENENIDKNIISDGLSTAFIGRELIVFESIDSTNSEAKRRVISDFKNGLTIISEEQTLGRGRLGRDWISPKHKGLWMTVVFKPKSLEPKDGSKLTIIAAAAVAKAIEKTTNIKVDIKWPNDIICNGKKVCGILTEMGTDPDIINWLVLGIGINVNQEKMDFPEEIQATGTSLKIESGKQKDKKSEEVEANFDRNTLAIAILNEIELLTENFIETGDLGEVLDYYNEKVLVKDKMMIIHKKNEQIRCIGVNISNEGHLIVMLEDGTIQEYFSGEVSVRGINGYI